MLTFSFFEKRSFRYENDDEKSKMKNDRFHKTRRFVNYQKRRNSFSKSSKRVFFFNFLKRSFFPKTKRSFLKTIENGTKNDRLQKQLTTLEVEAKK